MERSETSSFLHRSQNSEVGIATRLLAGRSGVRILAGVTDFSSLKRPNRLLGPSSLFNGYGGGGGGGFFPGGAAAGA